MAKLDISQQEYEKLRSSGMSKDEIVSKYSKKPFSLGGAIEGVAKGVTKFIGAEGISEQYGASLARTGLKLSGNAEAAQYVQDPSFRKVVGSAIQTGANFIPVVGRGASLATKVAAGAGTGYAFDVGGNLQLERKGAEAFRPGIGTVVGGSVPILGKILGYTTKNLPAKIAKKLEDTNLRLTPVERQNLEKKGQDIVDYLTQKKVVGTPQMRLGKVTKLYDNMEDTIQQTIKRSGVTYKTKELIDDLAKLPDGFIDDPELASEATNVVNKLIKNLQTRGGTIDASSVNKLKRNYMNRAFAKNATDVISDSRLAVGALLNGKLRGSISALERLNLEYGYIIASKRAMQKALSRPQIGLVGKLAGITAGTAVGGTVGGGAGAAAGAIIGPTIGKTIAGTLPRSAIGASLQTIAEISNKIQNLPTDRLGFVSQKAVLNLLQSLKSEQ